MLLFFRSNLLEATQGLTRDGTAPGLLTVGTPTEIPVPSPLLLLVSGGTALLALRLRSITPRLALPRIRRAHQVI